MKRHDRAWLDKDEVRLAREALGLPLDDEMYNDPSVDPDMYSSMSTSEYNSDWKPSMRRLLSVGRGLPPLKSAEQSFRERWRGPWPFDENAYFMFPEYRQSIQLKIFKQMYSAQWRRDAQELASFMDRGIDVDI